MRLIDADALIAWTDNYYVSEKFTVGHFANMVKDMPTIEPERKTGHWIYRPEWSKYGDVWSCSECGEKTSQSVMGKPRFKYCPMCRAKMDGDEDDRKTDC